MSQRNWVRPQHQTGSLYGGCSQGVDWPTRLFRQWPVLRLQRRARGTSTWAALGDWTETNTVLQLFRWFKFTLKPPYSIAHDKLQLAVWDTSFWTFLAQIWTQRTLRHILGSILVIFEICQFLTIPGPFEYFSENGWSQKIKVFSMKEWLLPPYQFSLRRRGP